ncbi:MAG: hypothetical protein EXR62_18030 [Chloroflexi bacterium]|nr:hypothetical protein [Chloroflexota bacterium]
MKPASRKISKPPQRKKSNLEMLEQKLREKGIIQGDNYIVNPPGTEKMSEVMMEFIEPYMEFATTSLTQYKQLVELAIIAWNAAILPKKEREILLNETLKNTTRPANEDMDKEFRAVVMDLIQRKERHFAKNKRLIVSYRASETKDTFHLAIVYRP